MPLKRAQHTGTGNLPRGTVSCQGVTHRDSRNYMSLTTWKENTMPCPTCGIAKGLIFFIQPQIYMKTTWQRRRGNMASGKKNNELGFSPEFSIVANR